MGKLLHMHWLHQPMSNLILNSTQLNAEKLMQTKTASMSYMWGKLQTTSIRYKHNWLTKPLEHIAH